MTPADLSFNSTDLSFFLRKKNLSTAIKAPPNIANLDKSRSSAVKLFSNVPKTLIYQPAPSSTAPPGVSAIAITCKMVIKVNTDQTPEHKDMNKPF